LLVDKKNYGLSFQHKQILSSNLRDTTFRLPKYLTDISRLSYLLFKPWTDFVPLGSNPFGKKGNHEKDFVS